MTKATIVVLGAGLVFGCGTPPHAVDGSLDCAQVERLVRKGRFADAQALVDAHRLSDPNIYWGLRLWEAKRLWLEGKHDECLREYQEFFQFYQAWQKQTTLKTP